MTSLQDFAPLKPAEQKLLAVASAGKQCAFGRTRPETPTGDNLIRADFVRFLALGRDAAADVHEGGLKIQGAYIDGTVNLDGATKVRPLWIVDCTITGACSFREAETNLVSLDRTVCSSIEGNSAKISGSLLLRGTVIAESLQLYRAEIAGALSCLGCRIEGKRWRSQRLAADLTSATIGGDVEFRDGFLANGVIQLDDSVIGGTLACSEANFHSGFDAQPQQASSWDGVIRVLKCHRIRIKGALDLRDCKGEAELSFSGARIGGDIDCRNGHFQAVSGGGTALRFTRIETSGNVYLSSGFKALGKVQFNGAKIRGNVDCQGGVFSVPGDLSPADLVGPGEAISEDAISIVNAEIGGALITARITGRDYPPAVFDGSLDFKSSSVHVLVDGPEAWPKPTHASGRKNVIYLDGFTYDRFAGNSPVDAETRIKWLLRQPAAHLGREFKPQPFEQVVEALNRAGYVEEAHKVRKAKETIAFQVRAMRAPRLLRPLWWALKLFWGGVCVYGFRPQRLIVALIIMWISFAWVYKIAAQRGGFGPADPQLWASSNLADTCKDNWVSCQTIAENIVFEPLAYSADVLLPIIDLKQRSVWQPLPREFKVKLGLREEVTVPRWSIRFATWIENILGAAGTLLVGAIMSGLIRR